MKSIKQWMTLSASVSAATLLGASAPAENWPQFRGPGGRGLSPTAGPVRWDLKTGENLLWRSPIPGLGHAAPVLWGDRLYLATATKLGAKAELKIGIYGSGDSYSEKEPHQWRLLCLDAATGREVWNRSELEAVPRQVRHTKASHCNSTPATDGRRIVAIFGSEGLFAFDMEGRPLWRKDLGKMEVGPWDAPEMRWGFASSPLLHQDRVFVQCDTFGEPCVAAFDAVDGRELWRTPRQEVPNWCTPAVSEETGQLVLNGWKQIAGYDLGSGRLLWQLHGGGDIPVPAPLVAGPMAFLTSAHGKYRPLRAVRLEARGDVTPPEMDSTNTAVAWCFPRLGSYMQTPIALGPLLWSCDWNGVLSCVETATGKLRYSERLGSGGQAFTASPVAAGSNLYFTSENGEVFVVPATPEFRVAATNRLGGDCLASPAAARGVLYFRTTEELIALGAKP